MYESFLNKELNLDNISEQLLESYKTIGGINHIEGPNLPSKQSIISILQDLYSILFPGFYEDSPVDNLSLKYVIGQLVVKVYNGLLKEIEKSLCFQCNIDNHLNCEECQNVDDKSRKSVHIKQAKQITANFINYLPTLREILKNDVEAIYDGDPAAKSQAEVILCYPGLLAITTHRLAHLLYKESVPLIPRMMSEYIHHLTGIDIHPGAQVGERFCIDHGTGIIIGETSVIGNNVKIYQGVTLGALSVSKSLANQKRHPTIEDDVVIYAGSTILGGNTVIGKGSIIGGNMWIVKSVPPNSKEYYK